MSSLASATPTFVIYKQNAQSIGTTSQGFFPLATLLGSVTMYIESSAQIGTIQWFATYDKVNSNVYIDQVTSSNLAYAQGGANTLQLQLLVTDPFLTITYNNAGFCTIVSTGPAQNYNIILYVQNLIGTTGTVLPAGGQLVNSTVAGTASVLNGTTTTLTSALAPVVSGLNVLHS